MAQFLHARPPRRIRRVPDLRARGPYLKSIRSRDNPLFRELLALKGSPRERRRAGKALLEGAHLIGAHLDRKGTPLAIAVSAAALGSDEIRQLLAKAGPPEPVVLAEGLFREISSVTTPAGIVAVVPIPPAHRVQPDVPCCVLLEGVQDPGNLGSILRSATAAGVRHVLLSKGCADPWSPRVLRGAMGAHDVIAIEDHADLETFARAFRGQVVAADAKAGKSLYALDLTPPTALVFGNEGAGISPALVHEADVRAAVPMANGIDSISVAAAAAAFLFERARQLAAMARIR